MSLLIHRPQKKLFIKFMNQIEPTSWFVFFVDLTTIIRCSTVPLNHDNNKEALTLNTSRVNSIGTLKDSNVHY